MSEFDVASVMEYLRLVGLTHDVFDPEEIARDLAERTELNQTLDELVGSSETVPAPASFDPEWVE